MEGIYYLFYGIYFLFAIFLAFFIQGNLLLNNIKISPVIKFSSSIILGMGLWIIQGFILGYLHLRELTFLYILITLILWTVLNFKKFNFKRKIKFKIDKYDFFILIIFIVGIALQTLTVLFNAIPIKNGLYFCCGGADALYHAGLVKELINNFPPNEPGINGLILKNYHFLSNLAIADLIRVFKLPLLQTEFNFIPLFMTLMFGLCAYSNASLLKLGKKFIIFFLFLLFFFSDIFYILTLLTTHKLFFNVSTIETSLSLWISYTRFFGVVFFLQSLSFLLLWLDKKTLKYFIPLLITSGLLIGLKVYIGILFLTGMGFLGLFYFYKKDLRSVLSVAAIFILSALVYLPVNSGSGGLIFTGFWRSRDFITNPIMDLNRLELARIVFESAGNQKKYIFDLLFIFIYVFFSLGILLISFLNPVKNLKRIPFELHIFLISGLITTFILGMFFIQKTGGANSSQFLISIYLVGIFYAALFLDYLFVKRRPVFNFLIFLLLIITIPKTIHITFTQLDRIITHEFDVVTNDTLSAFNFINNNIKKESVFIIDPKLKNVCILLPLLTASNALYCSSGSPVDRGIDTAIYEKEVSKVLNSNSGNKNLNFNFILTFKDKINKKGQKTIYSNNAVKILRYE